MKVIKVVLVTFLSLVIVAALLLGVVYYILYPKPEILGLVPDTPVMYVALSDLDKTVSAIEDSEFVDRVDRSPLWREFKSSGLWRQMKQQKRIWERQIGIPIQRKDIMQLVGKDALLAFYGGQEPWSSLLISEVGPLTRLNITSGNTKRMLALRYKFSTEEYRGIELMTLAVPGLKFSYCFTGRVGLLGMDESLLKKAVDLYRGSGQGLALVPSFKELVADLPRSDICFYVDVAKARESTGLSRSFPLKADMETDLRLRYLTSVMQHVDSWAAVGFRQDGNLRFDVRMLLHKEDDSQTPIHSSGTGILACDGSAGDSPPVPSNCLLFVLYETLPPGSVFEMLKALTGLDLDAIRDKLLPVLRSGAALAVLEPNIKEFQLLPPVMAFFWVKDRAVAETALEDLKGSTRIGGKQLRFTEVIHEDMPINYTRLPIAMGMSIDIGYCLMEDGLLAIATDISALKTAIDVALGKQQSLMKDEKYAHAIASMPSHYGTVFVNVESVAATAEQTARLGALMAKVAGEREAERIATILYQNAFILEAWKYMGAAFALDGNKTRVSLLVY